MEDRYLFKAKRKDNGQWVKGAVLFHDADAATIFNQHPADGSLQGFEVDPSTICQCTGLKDKTGNLIWENDIVEFKVYYWEKLEQSTISQVKWCDELCSLSIIVNDRGTRGTLGHLLDENKEIEVLGNVFDNPELLESEEKWCEYDRE